MRIEQLQAFLSIIKTGSFQKAAKECGLTQSTVSRQIQSLEEELGIALFHRTAQIKLTVGGERFFPRARKICQEWSQATEELQELLAGKQQELCVAAIHSVCAHYLPPVLQQFCQEYPHVQLRVTALGSDRALKVLNDGLVDLTIVMNNRRFTTSADMEVAVLFEETIRVLMAANHPLAQLGQVTWLDLINYPQVVFKDGYGMQRLVQEEFERHGATLNAVVELNTPDAFRGVVRQSHWVALLPDSALVDALNDSTLTIRDLVSHPDLLTSSSLELPLKREVVMVTTTDRLQIPPIKRFWDLVKGNVPPQLSRHLGEFSSPRICHVA